MASKEIVEATALLKSGDRNKARQILSALVQSDPTSAEGWYLLSYAIDAPDKVVYCLERAEKLAPLNKAVRERLSKLKPQPEQTPAPPADPVAAALDPIAQSLRSGQQPYGVIIFLTLVILVWFAIAFIQISFAGLSNAGIGSMPITVCISGLWNIFVSLFNVYLLLEVIKKKKDMTRSLYLLSFIGTLFSLAQLFLAVSTILACIAPLYMGLGFFTYVEQSKLKVVPA